MNSAIALGIGTLFGVNTQQDARAGQARRDSLTASTASTASTVRPLADTLDGRRA